MAASNASDQRINLPNYWASNYGSCVDLFAPVEDDGGTSLATPMVTGVAALYLQLYPTASPSSVTSAILGKTTNNVLTNIGVGSPNRLLYSKPPTLIGRIVGSDVIGPFSSCTWTSTVSGGQPAYRYEWRRDGVVVSTSTSYSTFGESSGFTLELSVTDGVGRTGSDTKSVSVDPNNTELQCT